MAFETQYYYFVAGLPDISFDTAKLPFTVEEFRLMLDEVLSKKDKALIDKYFLKYDDENLLAVLKQKNASINAQGKLSREDFLTAIEKVREDIPVKNRQMPHYHETFIKEWLQTETVDENKLWEDLMTSFSMEYGAGIQNSLISRWFRMNLDVGNILSAIYSRKYNLPVAQSIVGDNEIAKIIRENTNARDFGLGMEVEFFDALLRLSEEADIYERERKIDKFRWDWLEENTVFDYFNIEYIFAYLCKLQILERWVNLNAEEGERVFRELIAGLKSDVKMPEE